MKFELLADGPLDARLTLARYRIWGEDPANRLAGETFRRVLRLDGRLYGYQFSWSGPPDAARVTVALPGSRSTRVAEALAAEVRRLLFFEADLCAFYRLAKSDPALSGLVGPLYGLRPTLAPTPLEMLVGAISAQQVNLAFAVATRARLIRRFGEPVTIGGEVVWAFPAAERLAGASVDEFRAMQFSRRKAEYIIGLARQIARGDLDFQQIATRSNEEIIALLTRIRGLGRWTSEWFLARALGRGDVCPAGDLAVRKCFAHFYHRGRQVKERTIRRRARQWGEHQNLAIHYLLAGLRLAREGSGGGT
jgi:DNA-3-methyladenine glycosylase II